MSSPLPSNPLATTVRWLAAHARFPATRLEGRAETMLCMAALAAAESEADRERFLIQSRNGAKDSALRSHNLRRSLAHYVSDNKQKT
jgi:adenylyl- and sulfurtransferase ThiI